ncbi:hypothetical protein PTTG_01734 [Puccinia triticina 1-1 BBBD Race 1]|uniref:Cytochrome P450 n=2 Tax=Puccinia triticina TaxID=208348 RepID=A0A180G2R0_PUCT1|nr:uncharacterized protein PtA15_11A694 [Puccinia triticina]OAV86123.1 hypothetical protein PTTG_01734 [Puccinia triticina 1-1 BBBD Race 1]WAQ90002.1 hypothetical protein PtA15_11A694 [Puccinia triticina]
MIFTLGNLVALTLVYLLIKYRNRAIGTKKRNDPAFSELPGWPLLGELPGVIKNRSRPLEDFTIKALKMGPGFSFTLPGIRIIDISKPDWLEYVQKTNFDNYVKGHLLQPMWDMFGQGIFVADGELWKRARQATSTIFTVKTFKTIIEPSATKTMGRLAEELKSAAEEQLSIDICDLFFRFTLDSLVQMTFGKDLEIIGTKHSGQSKSTTPSKLGQSTLPFVDAFNFAQDQSDFRMAVRVGWGLIESISPMGKNMTNSLRVIDDFAYSLIDERIALLSQQNGLEDQELPEDLLTLFINARDDRGGGLGRVELRDTAMTLLFAGRDTTAQTLSWSFFHLLMNKELVSKIREEANTLLGGEVNDSRHVTYANHRQFVVPYSVILETLRLHPSVPKNGKIALGDDQIPGGPTIQAGDAVRWSDWQMGRDAAIWPDCGEFKPDRWIDQAGRIKQSGQFKFHAFNGGPRLCLGMNLAMFEAVKVIVEVFQNFELEFSDGWLDNVPKSEMIEGIPSRYQVPAYKASLTLPMENPMMISVKHRN